MTDRGRPPKRICCACRHVTYDYYPVPFSKLREVKCVVCWEDGVRRDTRPTKRDPSNKISDE